MIFNHKDLESLYREWKFFSKWKSRRKPKGYGGRISRMEILRLQRALVTGRYR